MSAAAASLTCSHRQISVLRSTVSDDIRRYLTKSPHDLARGDSFKTRLSACLTPEVFPVLLYRIAHFFYASGWRRIAAIITWSNQAMNRVHLTAQSCIGPGLRLPHPAGVTFHGRAGHGLTLYSLAICCPSPEHWDGALEAAPSFGDQVTVAAHAVVQGPVTVGDGATIAYGIQLDRDAPAGVLVSSRLLRVGIRRRTSSRDDRETA
jgi:serine O-acetyltransferase